MHSTAIAQVGAIIVSAIMMAWLAISLRRSRPSDEHIMSLHGDQRMEALCAAELGATAAKWLVRAAWAAICIAMGFAAGWYRIFG